MKNEKPKVVVPFMGELSHCDDVESGICYVWEDKGDGPEVVAKEKFDQKRLDQYDKLFGIIKDE